MYVAILRITHVTESPTVSVVHHVILVRMPLLQPELLSLLPP